MSRQTSMKEMTKLKEQLELLTAENDKLREENEAWEKSVTDLLQSEQSLLALVNKVPVGIFATGANGDFLFVNERWSQIVGIVPEQAVGAGWVKAVHPEDLNDVLRAWYDSAGKKPEFSLEFRFLPPSGESVWVFCRMQANLDDNNEIEGYWGTIIDITERKGYEEEVRKLNTELEERVHQRTMQLSVLSEENAKKFKEISLLYRLSNTMLSTIKLNKLIHLILTALTSGENPFFDRAMLFLLNERARVMQGMLGVTRETSQEFVGIATENGDLLAGRWDLAEAEMARQRDSEFSRRVRGSRWSLTGGRMSLPGPLWKRD